MIRFCRYLRHQSNKAYETLRQSGIISLPSQRTLRDYSHAVKAEPGFSKAVDQQLMLAAKVSTCPEWEKFVVVLMDEMYIKEDLVYNKHTGTLIGFVNLGDVNNHLMAFERSLDEETQTEPPLAKTIMTFMVRGLLSSLRYVYMLCVMSDTPIIWSWFPYAHFPCSNLSGELLFDPFWETVFRLGMKVLLIL